MKKKALSIIAISSLAAITVIATISASSAWYTGKATITTSDNITGTSQGAYFAGGDGTASSPFKITNKWHMYNLAWLTYIGWFDSADGWGQDKEVKQPYFILEGENNTIDMEGLVIPPIGTSAHPFKGNFNGNNNVIINFGISNRMQATAGDGGITRKPTTVSNTLSDVEIVGLFGVVGLLPSNSTASYDSEINSIYNFGVDDITVQTQASTNGNLVGLAAGYVNATVSGVAVGESKFDIADGTHLLTKTIDVVNSANVTPSYLSYYSTVGYCTEDFKNTAQVVDITAETPNVKSGAASSSGNFFGASIPMQTIYQHLKDVKGLASAQANKYKYISKEKNYYNSSNVLDSTSYEYTDAPSYETDYNNSVWTYSFSGPTEKDQSGNQIASYNFGNRTGSDQWLYLDGQRTLTVSNGKRVERYDEASGTAYYIYDNNGHYLGLSGTTIATVDESNAVPFVYTNSNLTTNISGTTYYLYSSSTGNLTLSTNNATTWTISGTNFYNNQRGYIVYYNGTWTTRTSLTESVYYIHDGDVYLGLEDGELVATDSSNKIGWKYENNYLSAVQNGTTYYLYTNEEWYLYARNSTYYRSQWTLNSGRFYNSTYGYIVYDPDYEEWITAPSLTPNKSLGWTISSGTNYVGLNGTSLINTDSSNAQYFWADNQYLGLTIDGDDYYFNRYGFTAATSNRLTRTSSTATSSPLYVRTGRTNNYTYYYLAYSDGNWGVQQVSSRSGSYQTNLPYLTFTEDTQAMDYSGVTSTSETVDYSSLMKEGSAYQYTSYSTANSSYTTNPTYFPLKYTSDYSDIGYSNTGYVVGGGNFTSSADIIQDKGAPGDIRVAQYAMSSLSAALNSASSYNSSRFEVITKTAYSAQNVSTNGGYVRISDGYNKNNTSVSSSISGYSKIETKTLGLKKYTTARDYFHTTLTNSPSYVYGLHFMDAQISKNRIVSVERVMANGWEYMPDGTANHYVVRTDGDGNPVDINGNKTNDSNQYVYDKIDADTKNIGAKYTLPQDCIDFHLSDNGTINFFAGSYFTNNKTFFSLHRIIRDSNEVITDIKEISKVYNNSAYHSITNNTVPRYIYQYSDNSYSTTPTEGIAVIGDLLFDTTWITTGITSHIVQNAAYYFEIPAIPGEYALGSVSGYDGAYLMYLDIGASEESNDIIIVEEVVHTTTDNYVFPKGVDFVILTTGETTAYVSTQGGDIGTVVIPNGVSGNNISFTLANKILTCGPPTGGSITQSTFINDGSDIKCNGTSLTKIVQSTSTKLEEITTKWTFSTENDELFKDVTTVTTVNGESTTVVSPQTSQTITQESYESTMKIKITEGSTDTYVEFWYQVPIGSTVTISYEYTYNPAQDKYTYVFTVTCADAPVVIHVTSIATGYYVAFKGVNEAGTGYDTYDATANSDITIRAGTVSSGS